MSQEIFESYIDNAFGSNEQASFKFKQFKINYKAFFPLDKGARCLDIGVGRGEMLTSMLNWGYSKPIGVDISPSTINFCNKLGLECEQTENTTTWLCAHENSFDLITLLDVLEHVPRDETIMFCKALKKSLKPGGTLIIQVPNLQAPDGHLHHFNDFTHVNGFIQHSLEQVLKTAGFSQFSFYGFEEFYGSGFKVKLKKILRFLIFKWVKFKRAVTGNINPEILTPVFFAVIKK